MKLFQAYEEYLEELWSRALSVINSCDCKNGCPCCIKVELARGWRFSFLHSFCNGGQLKELLLHPAEWKLGRHGGVTLQHQAGVQNLIGGAVGFVDVFQSWGIQTKFPIFG